MSEKIEIYCPKCGHLFKSESAKLEHYNSFHEEILTENEINSLQKNGVVDCPECGESFPNATAMLQHYDKHESDTESNQKAPSRSKRKYVVLALAVVSIVIITVAGVYFYQQNLEVQSIKSISVALTSFDYTKSTSIYLPTFTADVELMIYNGGSKDVSLELATTTLFVNGINVGTKGFATQMLVIPANSYASFTCPYVTFDADNVKTLEEATSYHTQLELTAMGKSGGSTLPIDVTHDSWY